MVINNIHVYQIKNYLSDLDKLDIFEQYGSNYVGIASFQHYQTAGADVEAALKRWDFSIFGAASTSTHRGGGDFFFWIFQKSQGFQDWTSTFLVIRDPRFHPHIRGETVGKKKSLTPPTAP